MAKPLQCIAGLIVAIAIGVPAPAAPQKVAPNDESTTLNAKAFELYGAGKYSEAIPFAQRALVIREKTRGPNHPSLAPVLTNLAALYEALGRYTEAEPLYKRALTIFEKSLGPDHPNIAKVLNGMAVLYKNQGRYTDAEPLYKRAVAIGEKKLGPNHPDLATYLNNLATLYYDQNRFGDAESLYKRALAIEEKALGPDHPDVAGKSYALAAVYQSQARYVDAEQLYKRAIAIFTRVLGTDHPRVAMALNGLGELYRNEGRYREAEPLYKRSLAINEKAFGPDHPVVAGSLNNQALLYLNQGRYSDAEPLLKQALAIREKTLGADHSDFAQSLNNLAAIYQDQGRYVDAEPLYKRSLAINEKAFGPDNPAVARSLNNLAELYRNQARYGDAELLYKRSLAIREKTLGLDHPNVATVLNNLALLYDDQGRDADAESLFKRALVIREKALGPDHPDFAQSLNNLAVLYQRKGRYRDAEQLHKRSLAIREKALGPNHPDVAVSLNNLAMLYKIQGRYADGLPIVQRTIAQNTARKSVSLGVLHGSENRKLIAPKEALNASYTVVQQSVSSAAGEAISKLAARFAAGTDELAQLVRKDQDLTTEADRLDKNIIAAVSKAPAERNVAMEDQIRKRINEIKSERDRLQDVFNQQFPDYVALSKPQPLSVAGTQALLADDEALVVFYFDAESYAWVITKTDASWVELKVASKDLDTEIMELRQWLISAGSKPFDTALSYKIYQSTFGPIAGKIASKKRLSLITNGALTSLPPQLLITSDPTGKTLKNQAWLVRSYAITVLPTVASLRILRGASATSSAAKPMIAFADPVFSKQAHVQATQQLAMRSIPSFYNGTQIDVARLGEYLPQLPGTRAEVQAIGKTLKADPSDLKLGLNATVTAVKQAKLDQYRIVYFATHGLVSGELERFAKSKAEPALVLTIPDKPTDFDNGLLQASEIAQLKLNADWVVLSACNTAAEEKPGAEALSGLARAFFYAGGRSLIVSNWQVDDESTARLMLNTFQASTSNAKLSQSLSGHFRPDYKVF
jgi:tetratricopeptide (TPR) repeat protein